MAEVGAYVTSRAVITNFAMGLRFAVFVFLLTECCSFLTHPSFTRVSSKRWMSDWSDFQALDDDEDLAVDMTEYAAEGDSQEYKAQIGAQLDPPTIENDAEPIFVPQGKPSCNSVRLNSECH